MKQILSEIIMNTYNSMIIIYLWKRFYKFLKIETCYALDVY